MPRQPTLVILDIWLQGSELDGIEILRLLRAEMPAVPVVMISGHGTIETAVEAIKIGAYDFIEKPFKSDRLLLVVERAIEAALAAARERGVAAARRRRYRPDRRLAVGQPAAPADRQGGADRQPGADHRAARRRQGGRRPAAASALAPGQGPVRPGQLRDDAAGAARDRAVRHRDRQSTARRARSAPSSARMAARCSSTRSPTCRSKPRARSCACCRSRPSSESAGRAGSRSMSGSSPRPTASSPPRSAAAGSARICSIG